MNSEPQSKLKLGAEVLKLLMVANGFEFSEGLAGNASGGPFAQGCFQRDDRRLELHYRHGLGIVTYWIGEDSLEHLDYMKLLGIHSDCAFASAVKDDSLDGFCRLKSDLERFGADFLYGDGKQFTLLARKLRENPDLYHGFGAIGN